MDCKFTVGQKVVCINDNWDTAANKPPCDTGPNPIKGDVCTISLFHEYLKWVFIGLKEHSEWIVFNPDHFKPLEEKEIDISIFTKMLKPRSVLELI